MKGNCKALNKKTMDIFLYGDVPHPTYKQIREAEQEKKDFNRQKNKLINLVKFNIVSKIRKPKSINYQIQNGFDIAKKWRDEYAESNKTESIL